MSTYQSKVHVQIVLQKQPTARHFVLVLLVVLLIPIMLVRAGAKTIVVDAPDSLEKALLVAVGGDLIKLSGPQQYSLAINAKTFAPPVTIESLDFERHATLTNVVINQSDGIVIKNVNIKSLGKFESTTRHIVTIIHSRGITISNSDLTGSASQYLTPLNQKVAQGENLMIIRWSNGITIDACDISGFYQGIALLESTNVKIRGNQFHAMQGDGIRMGGVQRIEISDNNMHDFLGSDQAVNHSDMIQLWSTNARLVSRDITVRRNRLVSGDGPATQSIFLRNEKADKSPLSGELMYANIIIEDNLIHNGHSNGIYVGQTNGVAISHNTLLPNSRSYMGSAGKLKNYVPTIKVASASTRVEISKNVAIKITAPASAILYENYILPPRDGRFDYEMSQLYSSTAFSGRLAQSNYIARPDSVISQKKLGSSMTH
jgi:nitrous oxidase accessory protein NosD